MASSQLMITRLVELHSLIAAMDLQKVPTVRCSILLDCVHGKISRLEQVE